MADKVHRKHSDLDEQASEGHQSYWVPDEIMKNRYGIIIWLASVFGGKENETVGTQKDDELYRNDTAIVIEWSLKELCVLT